MKLVNETTNQQQRRQESVVGSHDLFRRMERERESDKLMLLLIACKRLKFVKMRSNIRLLHCEHEVMSIPCSNE